MVSITGSRPCSLINFSLPGWFLLCHFFENRTGFHVGPGKITRTHQEFIDDLAAGKPECLFEKFHPFFFSFWVMMIKPIFERTGFFLDNLYFLSIMDSRLDF